MASAESPRAARVVPLCAGAYVSGADGSNECPAGSVRIEDEAMCRTAAAAAGMKPWWDFVETDPTSPRGCFYERRNVYLNSHAVGAGHPYWFLLCAALTTTGAPLHALMRRRACTARCSRAVWLMLQMA
jgi:hypothetical protein